MIEILEISKTNSNRWLWDNNREVDNGKLFLLHNMQDYIRTWINVRSPGSLEALKKFCEKEIELYPDIIFGYNNYAYYFVLTGDRETALHWFLEAEKIDGEDSIVLLNIARNYLQGGQTEKAKEYLQKVIEAGDPQYSEFAQEQLEEIE